MSNLPTTASNALTLSQMYPPDRYNVLVPIQTVTEIAEIQKPVLNAVSISSNPADGEVYRQGSALALTKRGLLKLMRAAGIRMLDSKSEPPSVCQKCAQVNASIGKPVNCGNCKNKDVRYTVTISAPQLTGQDIIYKASREIHVDDETEGMTPGNKAQFLKYRSEHCESKALNRAIREALMIKSTYTAQELQKPFVVAYLAPNLDNDAVKARAIDGFFAEAKSLYGNGDVKIPDGPRVIEVMDDDEPEYMDGAVSDSYGTPVDEALPFDEPMAVQPVQNSSISTSGDMVCAACGLKLSDKVYQYSMSKFGRPLCYSCQKAANS